ncbi:MAG TPA: fatty acid desaturase [Pseudomonadota bacterium]|nr:fatty acid desaturase [Pseudomonadota bacterium]
MMHVDVADRLSSPPLSPFTPCGAPGASPLFTELSRPQKQAALTLRPLLSCAVLAYTLLGYLVGLACVLSGSPLVAVAGIALLIHTTVLSGLLNHELIHRSVFRNPRVNDLLGSVVSLLNGACHVPFALLRRQHIAHHINKVGYDSFSITEWVKGLPRLPRIILITLEWFYFPILSFISRGRALTYPFRNKKYRHLRLRVAVAILFRMAILILFYLINPWSVLSVFISHIGMISAFRLYDCYHHTFQVIPLGSKIPVLPGNYEQERTFSSLLSREHAWLNLIFLNYGYHNAHHYLFAAPWYHLPTIDRLMFGESNQRHILFRDWITWYHKNRIRRIFDGLGSPRIDGNQVKIESFYGIIMNLSFMDYDYNDE